MSRIITGSAAAMALAIGLGAGIAYERHNASENVPSTTEAPAGSSPENTSPAATIGNTAVSTTTVAETIPSTDTPKTYPLSGFVCRGAEVTITVDERAFFQSTGQYSVLKTVVLDIPGSTVDKLPEDRALLFARDLADANGLSARIPDVNAWTPGEARVGTDCVDPATGAIVIPAR